MIVLNYILIALIIVAMFLVIAKLNSIVSANYHEEDEDIMRLRYDALTGVKRARSHTSFNGLTPVKERVHNQNSHLNIN